MAVHKVRLLIIQIRVDLRFFIICNTNGAIFLQIVCTFLVWGSSRPHSWFFYTSPTYINDLPDDVICDIAIYSDDTTLYSKRDQASDLQQQLKLASELKSDLRDTVDWGKKWFGDFNTGKTQLVLFD